MSAAAGQGALIKGWCPGALRPMLSGDGWVVRVRPPLGRLLPEQAAGIARLAARHGNGQITLSSRANVQIRGVSVESHAPLVAGLDALGLIDADVAHESRRNVVLTPFWQPGDGATALAGGLVQALTATEAPALPAKFGCAVDCGPVPVLQDISADIRLERTAAGDLICCADGASTGAPVTEDTAAGAVLALARWFAASGGIREGRGRMAVHVRRGAALPDAFRQAPRQRAPEFCPAPGAGPAGMLVALALGQIDAASLAALADAGPLRVTPWRMLLIEGAAQAPVLDGVIVDPADPLLRVTACTGAPGCLQALQPTQALARALAHRLAPGADLHVSGCAKACAHPAAAALTLLATADGFDVILDGTTSAPPAASGIAPDVASLSRYL